MAKKRPTESDVSAIPLTVTEPLDETTVYTADLVVKGQTEADAVVSVNEVRVDVDAEGKFSTMVTLEEGPNPIEVLASDFEGDEGSVSSDGHLRQAIESEIEN